VGNVLPEYVTRVLGGGDWVPPTTFEEIIEGRRDFSMAPLNQDLPDVAAVHEDVLLRERDGTRLTAEIYVPHGSGPFPAFLFLHGGAFCLESAADVRRLAMGFADRGHLVVSLDYGLAPEHPFPWAVEDCVYASRWLTRHAGDYGGDGSRIAIGGESAGANLAAAAIVALSGFDHDLDEGNLAGVPVTFSAAVFFYGIFDSVLAFEDPGKLVGVIEVMWHHAYMGPHFLAHYRHPLASPICAPNLDRFPPSYLACGLEDPVLNQTLALTQALARVGADATTSILPKTAHFWAQFDQHLPQAHDELERIHAWLADRTAS
jgi:acetyl esterase